MGILSVSEMRDRVDRKIEVFEVPEFGEGAQIKLRTISVKERDLIMTTASITGKFGGEIEPQKMERLLLIYGIAEPQLTPDDVEAIMETKNWDTIDRIVKRIMQFNGMTKEAEKESEISFRTTA